MKTYAEFVAESDIFNKCYPRAVKLLKQARKEGKPAQLIQVAGFKGDSSQADKRWQSIPQKHWQHYVTRIGDTIHDPTAKQFHPDAEEKYHHSKLASNWDQQYEVEPVSESTSFVAEAKHHSEYVGSWGVITHNGEHINGDNHPSAKSHAGLGGMHPVEYFQDHMSDAHEDGALSIRTHGNRGLALAIQHFDQLPHYKHGAVEHEHDEGDGYVIAGSRGKRHTVLAKMKRLAGRSDNS